MKTTLRVWGTRGLIALVATLVGAPAASSQVTYLTQASLARAVAGDGVPVTQNAQGFGPFITTLTRNASVNVGGQFIDTTAIAEISCHFENDGVNARTRLDCTGGAGVGGTAEVLIDVSFNMAAAIPFFVRVRGLGEDQTGNALMNIRLTSLPHNHVVFSQTFTTGQPDILVPGDFPAGDYRLVYSSSLGSTGESARDFSFNLKFGACEADMDDGTLLGRPDGGVDVSDLLFFLHAYQAGDLRADLDDGSGLGNRDDAVTIADLLHFLVLYGNGC